MAEPFKTVFDFPSGQSALTHPAGKITCVVMDVADFDSLCDSLVGVLNVGLDDAESLKSAQHIPIMQRGNAVEFVFGRFGIETDLASFIVRGSGPKVLKKYV